MANIDTNTIEGYADMTAEQKLVALESYELPEPDYTGWVKKDVLDNATKDASEWKKKYNSKLTEEEVSQQKSQEKDNKIAELTRLVAINDHKAKFLGLGYTEELANATAEAMADGNMEIVFANQKKFNEIYAAQLKADLLKSAGNPTGDSGEHTVDFKVEAQKALEKGDMVAYSHYMRKSMEK